ncbi:MAG: 5'-nucleotidase C-terminal domain-containing protein [Pseudomonadota bacterium]
MTDTRTATLRLISTTDLHMSLCAFDFHQDRPQTEGLEALVPLIEAARAEVANSLLMDNGDAIQGTPIAQWVETQPDDAPHPMIAAFNALGYDAATLGNHEFDFGLDAVARAYGQARFPVVCANIVREMGSAPTDDTPYFPPVARLERQIAMADGSAERLRIGIVGVMPPRVRFWHRHTFNGAFHVRAAEDAAAAWARDLSRDCDLVIALAHTGLVPPDDPHREEQAALRIAEIPEVDAVIAGHQHYAFPGEGWRDLPGIDLERGCIAGTPLVMARSHGRSLGIIDLALAHSDGGWEVQDGTGQLRNVGETSGPGPLERDLAPVRAGTRSFMAETIGTTPVPLRTHYASLVPTPAVRFLHAAQLAVVREVRPDLPGPLLSATSAFKSGRSSGYTSVDAGQVARRACSDLCPFENHIVVLSVSGSDLMDWIEQSAAHYAVVKDEGPLLLLDADVPGFNFDTFTDLTFTIDLTRRPKFGTAGELTGAEGRVRDVKFRGAPVTPEMTFTAITNSYRAAGGGGFGMLAGRDPLWIDAEPFSARLEQMFGAGLADMDLPDVDWTLTAPTGTRALFETGLKADAAPPSRYRLGAGPAAEDRKLIEILF